MRLAQRFTAFFAGLLMLALVACSASTHKSPGEVIDDTVITAKVKSALIADPDLKAYQINVETYKGTVQLSGFVSGADHIQKATQLTRDIKGVTSVKNDLSVRQ
jgi:osmotically-inducible protein OsmY